MDSVAAKVAEKIGVLFEHLDFNSGACEQKAKNHASGTAADDAASGLDGWGNGSVRCGEFMINAADIVMELGRSRICVRLQFR